MESIKENDPSILLSYFEFVIKLFGSNDPHIYYPLYFTNPINENEDEINEEQN